MTEGSPVLRKGETPIAHGIDFEKTADRAQQRREGKCLTAVGAREDLSAPLERYGPVSSLITHCVFLWFEKPERARIAVLRREGLSVFA